MGPETESAGAARKYRWPWFVLAGLFFALALAVLWMSHEIRRAQRIHDLNYPPPATNNAGAK